MLFAYLGPDTVLPLASAVAAVAGVILMFGQQVGRISLRMCRRVLRIVGLRRSPATAPGIRKDVAHLRASRPVAARRRESSSVTERTDA
jgi:hypothetical protein